MNSSNELDVAALLRELENSPAWQELKAATSAAAAVPAIETTNIHRAQPFAAPTDTDVSMHPQANFGASSSIPVPSVAALLSQLSSTTIPDPSSSTSNNFGNRYEYGASSSTAPPSSVNVSRSFTSAATPSDDRRSIQKYSFRQSLPILSELADNPAFVNIIKKMKSDQDQLERKLWADRESIYAKYQNKIKVAQTKAQMIGVEVSQHEINMLSDAYKKEIYKFDSDRVLPAWDGLVSRQQNELSQKGVPAMFVTSDVHDRETQQQVVGVLESIAGPLDKT